MGCFNQTGRESSTAVFLLTMFGSTFSPISLWSYARDFFVSRSPRRHACAPTFATAYARNRIACSFSSTSAPEIELLLKHPHKSLNMRDQSAVSFTVFGLTSKNRSQMPAMLCRVLASDLSKQSPPPSARMISMASSKQCASSCESDWSSLSTQLSINASLTRKIAPSSSLSASS